jgi:DNA mismatch endonuclease (patch repair protein)
MDVHSKERRSFNMSRIGGKNTKPELMLRKWLWHRGYRYRLHYAGLPGKPDMAFPGRKKVIFVNGCFWHRHGCRYFKWPQSNAEFWKRKIESNVQRDRQNYEALTAAGWSYLVVWECAFRAWKRAERVEKLARLGEDVERFLAPDTRGSLVIDGSGPHSDSSADTTATLDTQ